MAVDTASARSALPVRSSSTAAAANDDDDDLGNNNNNNGHSSAAKAATRKHASHFSIETVDNDPEGGVKVEDRAEATEGVTETDNETETVAAAPLTTTTADADADEPPPPKRRSLCDICHNAPAKYKCPRCPQAYCSVSCSRTHKDNHPPDATPDPKAKNTTTAPPATAQPTAAAAAAPKNRHPFRVLDDAPELQRLFQQYPGLPARLQAIHDATLPPPPAGAPPPTTGPDGGGRGGWRGRGRGRGGGGGFRGRGGGGGGGRGGRDVSSFHQQQQNNNNKPPQHWTREHGLRQGQRALRQARVDPGDDGDGVRAYCELVLHLLARDKAEAETAAATTAADEATALVRQEVARADAALVEQLLEAEKAAGGLR